MPWTIANFKFQFINFPASAGLGCGRRNQIPMTKFQMIKTERVFKNLVNCFSLDREKIRMRVDRAKNPLTQPSPLEGRGVIKILF